MSLVPGQLSWSDILALVRFGNLSGLKRKVVRAASANGSPIGRFLCVEQDLYGTTLCIEAAKTGRLSALRTFYALGADVSRCNSFSQTPLMFAALNGHHQVVLWLCEEAKVNSQACDREGETALMWAVASQHKLTESYLARIFVEGVHEVLDNLQVLYRDVAGILLSYLHAYSAEV